MNGLKLDRKKFWNLYHAKFGACGVVTQGTVDGLNYLLDRFETETRLDNIPQFSCVLATAFHETGVFVKHNGKKVLQRFQPVREGKAAAGSEVWIKYQSKYWNTGYYGRGFVQATWLINYLKLGKLLGIGNLFVENPDLLLENKWAYEALVAAMVFGLYRKDDLGRQDLDRYFPAKMERSTKETFYQAREIINGDKDRIPKGAKISNGRHIAEIAFKFQEILFAARIVSANFMTDLHSGAQYVIADDDQPHDTLLSPADAPSAVNPSDTDGEADLLPSPAGHPQNDPNIPPAGAQPAENQTPDANQSGNTETVEMNLEDWKPWAFAWLKRIWKGFTGFNLTQTVANVTAALKSGEYWYVPIIIIALVILASAIICALLSVAVIAVWLVNRREVNRAIEMQAQAALNPSIPNLELNIEDVKSGAVKLLTKIKGFAPAPEA